MGIITIQNRRLSTQTGCRLLLLYTFCKAHSYLKKISQRLLSTEDPTPVQPQSEMTVMRKCMIETAKFLVVYETLKEIAFSKGQRQVVPKSRP